MIDTPSLIAKAYSLVMQHRFNEAVPIYKHVLQRDPMHVRSMFDLGCVYRAMDNFSEARYWLGRVQAISPEFDYLPFAWAVLHIQLGDNDKAIEVLETIADDVNAKFLLSMLYLSNGDYERGFRMHHLRGQSALAPPPLYVLPTTFDHWCEVEGKTVAVLQDGGLGDAIQFCRYLPLMAKLAGQITYFVPPTMLRLFAQLPVQVAPLDSYDGSQYDLSTTDAEMPYHFRTTLATIPDVLPYLWVPNEAIQSRLLPETSKRRVGLCWAGGTPDERNQRPYDERRSFSLKQYAPLAATPDVEFVSLQFGQLADEVCATLPVVRVLDQSFDGLDTAAIIMQLDLVITVDTMIAHLAAAMGKPVWMLSRLDSCWRWLRNQPSSPWYPDVLRIIGQTSYRDWRQPVLEVARMLRVEFPVC